MNNLYLPRDTEHPFITGHGLIVNAPCLRKAAFPRIRQGAVLSASLHTFVFDQPSTKGLIQWLL